MQQFGDPNDAKRLALAIVESIPEPLVVLDSHMRLVSANATFFEAFEFDRDVAKIGRRTLLMSARTVDYGGSSAPNTLLAFRDITEARRAEAEKQALLERTEELLVQQQRSLSGNAAQGGQQSADHRQHSDAQGLRRDVRGKPSPSRRRPPARHVGRSVTEKPIEPGSGLGSLIIEALAKQLDAWVEIASSDKGMSVTVAHATFHSNTSTAA